MSFVDSAALMARKPCKRAPFFIKKVNQGPFAIVSRSLLFVRLRCGAAKSVQTRIRKKPAEWLWIAPNLTHGRRAKRNFMLAYKRLDKQEQLMSISPGADVALRCKATTGGRQPDILHGLAIEARRSRVTSSQGPRCQ